MSFLAISSRRLATVARTAARPQTGALSVASHFSTSAARPKSATQAAADTVKDTLKTVDRTVSDKLVDGINISETVAGKAKEVGQDIVSGKAAGKAEQLGNEAAAKGNEIKKDAEDKGEDLAEGAAKLKADAKDKVRQAADEVKKRV